MLAYSETDRQFLASGFDTAVFFGSYIGLDQKMGHVSEPEMLMAMEEIGRRVSAAGLTAVAGSDTHWTSFARFFALEPVVLPQFEIVDLGSLVHYETEADCAS